MARFVTTTIPDARGYAARRNVKPHDDVSALVSLIRNNCTSTRGERPSHAQIATLLGISESTLRGYCGPPRKRGRTVRGPLYLAVYALQVMVSNMPAAAERLWAE